MSCKSLNYYLNQNHKYKMLFTERSRFASGTICGISSVTKKTIVERHFININLTPFTLHPLPSAIRAIDEGSPGKHCNPAEAAVRSALLTAHITQYQLDSPQLGFHQTGISPGPSRGTHYCFLRWGEGNDPEDFMRGGRHLAPLVKLSCQGLVSGGPAK